MKTWVEELFHELAGLSVENRTLYFREHNIDTQTRVEVESLIAFDTESSVSLEQDIGIVARRALSRFDVQGSYCGPYRLGPVLGRGGMGTVHSAERTDGELSQRVAVKLLRPGSDDAPMRERFLAERQILANLSHPNIARLLDAGHREDGQPYLVMEYVEGKAIDTHTAFLPIRARIELFLKVCAAVSYLHRNLVVHRDLKPANIMVAADGEPKLLDFGIAKILDLTGHETVTAMRMLTPDYASPEQVSGGPITTATDVYSLGAVLYKLLTGASPHQFEGSSAAAVALIIADAKITAPSKLVPSLKGDLEIILMKALRKEPQERYPTADALAEDLRAYLECRPVQARAGDVWYRARRMLRHYWVPASVTALVMASLTTGIFVANRQRLIAERRFAQLRQLSARVIDADRAIRVLPGAVAARQRLVSASLEYLEGLSREAEGNLDLSQEISDGYWRLARIQGVNAEYNLGDPKKAEESLKKADALMERVIAARPLNREALFRSAVIAQDRMILADTEDRRSDVLNHARKAIDRLHTFLQTPDGGVPLRLDGFLPPGNPHESEIRGAVAIYINVAVAYVNKHLYAEGAEYARSGLELASSIPAARDVVCQALSVLANALRYQGDLDGALRTIRQARQISEQATYPNETARVFARYAVMVREGRILAEADAVNLDRPAEAITLLQRCIDMMEEAARKDPKDSASRARILTASRELADILRDRDPQRAVDTYDLGIRRAGEISNSVKARRDIAELQAKSSYPLRRLHRSDEAAARIDSALSILTTLKDLPAQRVTLGGYEFAVLLAQAEQKASSGDTNGSLDLCRDLLKKTLAADPKPEESLTDATGLSRLYKTMESMYLQARQEEAAGALRKRRKDLWTGWDARLPGNSFVKRQLAEAASSMQQTAQTLQAVHARF